MTTQNGHVGDARRRNRSASVIDAAVAVMSERGYSATTIQEVADRVGVLKGSLYHYFGSKEELLFRILESSHAVTNRIADELDARALPPLEHLCEYLRALASWYLDNADRANIYFTEFRNLTGDRLDTMQREGREFEQRIQRLVTEAQQAGEIAQDVDARIATRYILGSLNSVRSWPSRNPRNAIPVEKLVDAFVLMTRRALAEPGNASAPAGAGADARRKEPEPPPL